MKKIVRLAWLRKNKEELEKLFTPYKDHYSLDEKDPEFVISYGGDGTLMESEAQFPGVPKIYLKNSRVGKLAHREKANEVILDHFFKGEYKLQQYIKLAGEANGKTLLALNDIVIRNADPRYAVRYSVKIDGKNIAEEIIGDGAVFATPLGSTGYYRSITGSYFESGIGLAFSNSTEPSDHIVLKDDRVITITIVRGPAFCYADNQKESISLKENDLVKVYRSDHIARIVII